MFGASCPCRGGEKCVELVPPLLQSVEFLTPAPLYEKCAVFAPRPYNVESNIIDPYPFESRLHTASWRSRLPCRAFQIHVAAFQSLIAFRTPHFEKGGTGGFQTRRTSIRPQPKPFAGPMPSKSPLESSSALITSISPSKSTELNPAVFPFRGSECH